MNNLMEWIQTKLAKITYGSISITIKIHAGKISLIEKEIRETEQPISSENFNPKSNTIV